MPSFEKQEISNMKWSNYEHVVVGPQDGHSVTAPGACQVQNPHCEAHSGGMFARRAPGALLFY